MKCINDNVYEFIDKYYDWKHNNRPYS
jgi:hypothetical protein